MDMVNEEDFSYSEEIVEHSTIKEISPYGNYFMSLTKEQIEGLLEGKIYCFKDWDEYNVFLRIKTGSN